MGLEEAALMAGAALCQHLSCLLEKDCSLSEKYQSGIKSFPSPSLFINGNKAFVEPSIIIHNHQSSTMIEGFFYPHGMFINTELSKKFMVQRGRLESLEGFDNPNKCRLMYEMKKARPLVVSVS